MSTKKNAHTAPLGVPLGQLQTMLEPTSIEARLEGNTLHARHEHYTVRVEVVAPDVRETADGPIQAVVRLVTELPKPVRGLFQGREAAACAAFNAFAALGAFYEDGGEVRIGSRLTVYESEDAWDSLQLPLVLFTTLCGSEALLGAMRRRFAGEAPRPGVSSWTVRDFAELESRLSTFCVCTGGGLGLSAEFGLAPGAVSAVLGQRQTALFEMTAEQPHPELGGGLFCLLQLPQQVEDPARLQRLCLQLNGMEMAAHDLPPHFGAWCPGRLGDNPAYVSFLPNVLHRVPGIASNVAVWAEARAQWAHAVLASMGLSTSSDGER